LNPLGKKKRRNREVVQPLLFRQQINSVALARILQQVAQAMAPFYRAIARRQRYARQWSQAVINTDLAKLEQLLRRVSPAAARQGIASNGIGYFISFASPSPIDNYVNGVGIPPGSARFCFETRAHRLMAHYVLPFYEKLARDHAFANRLAQSILQRDSRAAARLIHPFIRTASLRSITIEDEGIVLTFAFPFSRFRYQNVLFREVIEPDWGGKQE